MFQNWNQDLLPDLEEVDDDESYVPSMSDGEAEYELPNPVNNGGDHNDDDGTHTEMQGVDTAEEEQEPTMIGDGAPLPAIHMVPEEVVPQAMEPEDFTMQPMGVDTINATTDPPPKPVAGTPVMRGATVAPSPLMPALVLPGTE